MGGGDSRRSPRHGHGPADTASPPRGALILPAKQLRPGTPGTRPARDFRNTDSPGQARRCSVLVPQGLLPLGSAAAGARYLRLLPPTTACPSEAEPELLPGHPWD